MSLFGQLICAGCSKTLTYSLGAVSCRCADCGTITPAQLPSIACPECKRELVAPINTIEILCPVCASTTLIPAELLPRVPTPHEEQENPNDGGASGQNVSMVVRNPTTRAGQQATVSVASKVEP